MNQVQFNNSFATQQDVENALQKIKYVNGRFVKVTFKNVASNGVTKIITGYYRLGINYGHIKSVQEENANRIANGIKKKAKVNNDTTINEYLVVNPNGELKLKMFPIPNSKNRTMVDYFLNGIQTTKQWLVDNGYLKVKPKKPVAKQMTIMVRDILAIG